MYRREIEVSFSQRIKEVEERFSGDQECVAQRFQADVLKLEQHYQSELKAISESHVEQKLHWEAEMQKAVENAEAQRKIMEEGMEQEKESLNQEWTKERLELESVHKEELEALVTKNQQLQNELDNLISMAQTKEIELSKQLNDLHNRLQDSLQTKEELMAQSDQKAVEVELLLNQTVEDFKAERAELLSTQSELEGKYNEMLTISEKQASERIELLTERDDMKMKIEELEMLLKQAAVDFDLERKELLELISSLEEKLKVNLEIAEKTETGESNETEEVLNTGEEQETCSAPSEICPDDVTLADFNQEVVCLSQDESIVVEEDVKVEIMETPDAVDECPENIQNATSGDDKDSIPEIKVEDTEYQEQADEIIMQDQMTVNNESQPESINIVSEGCDGHEEEEEPCNDHNPESSVPGENHCGDAENLESDENKKEAVSCEVEEVVSLLEAIEGEDEETTAGENRVAFESCEEENKPQDVPALDSESPSREDELCHETVVDPSALGETGDLYEPSPEDAEDELGREIELVCDYSTAELRDEHSDCTRDCLELLDEDVDEREHEAFPLLKLQALYNTSTEENILLNEKISLLQQKAEILENLLAHNNEKIKTGHQVLEENYSLKVKMLLLMEHIKAQELKALKMMDLEIRYEDCVCENAKLKDQNGELEKRVWSLESRMNMIHDYQDQHTALVDEISRMREENSKLSELFGDLEGQEDSPSAVRTDTESPESPSEEAFLDLNSQAVTGLQDCCVEFEMQNTKLRKAITELQDKSLTLNETTQVHR